MFPCSLGYAFAPRTFLKEKCIFVVVCISCLKKVLHLSNIFLLNNHFNVCDEKNERKTKNFTCYLFNNKNKENKEKLARKQQLFFRANSSILPHAVAKMKDKVTFFLLSHCLVSEGDKHFFWLIRLVSKVTFFCSLLRRDA